MRHLALAGAYVREIPLSPFQRFLSAIAHPNIAYHLMSLGFIGIYFELAHPGAVLPGVVGAIALAIGTPRSNLYKKMEQYEIKRRENGDPDA